VGGYEKKYVVNNPLVPIVRHVKEGTNLTHDEIITKKEVGFVFSEVVKCLFQDLFNN
jgi:hypothetical protein